MTARDVEIWGAMRCVWRVAIALVGCIDDDYDPFLEVRVHVAGAELDQLEVVTAPSPNNYWRNRSVGPLTPVLIAQGITEPPIAA